MSARVELGGRLGYNMKRRTALQIESHLWNLGSISVSRGQWSNSHLSAMQKPTALFSLVVVLLSSTLLPLHGSTVLQQRILSKHYHGQNRA